MVTISNHGTVKTIPIEINQSNIPVTYRCGSIGNTLEIYPSPLPIYTNRKFKTYFNVQIFISIGSKSFAKKANGSLQEVLTVVTYHRMYLVSIELTMNNTN
jgi:hypothetical protein